MAFKCAAYLKLGDPPPHKLCRLKFKGFVVEKCQIPSACHPGCSKDTVWENLFKEN